MGPLELLALRDANRSIDVTALLPQIAAPTLVIHLDTDFTPPRYSREFASDIPNAQLMTLSALSLGIAPSPEILTAVMNFFGAEAVTASATARTVAQSLATILFTDLASSTALTQRLGDAKAQELVRAHNTIVRDALAAHDGTEIKHTGDGIMASFGSVERALECAVAIQRGVAERDDAEPLR